MENTNGQFSESLISSGDPLRDQRAALLQPFCEQPTMLRRSWGRGICLLVVTSLGMRLACSINL